MSKTTRWPVTILKIEFEDDGHFKFLHTTESIGPNGICLFPFPVKWRDYKQWEPVEQQNFFYMMKRGNQVKLELNAKWHLVTISDTHNEYVINDEHDEDFFAPKPANHRGTRVYSLKTLPVNLDNQIRLPKAEILDGAKRKPLRFSFTLTSGSSEYKQTIELKRESMPVTRAYLSKLVEASETDGAEEKKKKKKKNLMLEAMLREIDMNIY